MTISGVDLLEQAEAILQALDARIEEAAREQKAREFLEQLGLRRARAEALGLAEIVEEIDRYAHEVKASLGVQLVTPEKAEGKMVRTQALVSMETQPVAEATEPVLEAEALAPSPEEQARQQELSDLEAMLSSVLGEIENFEKVGKRAGWDRETMAKAKALAAKARALGERQQELACPTDELERGIKKLRDLFSRHFKPQYYSHGLPLHQSRCASAQVWEQLSNAYSLLAQAEKAMEERLHEDQSLDQKEQEEVLSSIAAVEAHVFRLLRDEFDGASDGQQQDLHIRIKAVSTDEVWIPWWNQTNVSNNDVAKKAAEFPKFFAGRVKVVQSRRTVGSALASLQCLIEAAPAVEDFEARLVEEVRKCLEAGVCASNKEMRTLLLPYHGILDEAEDENVRRVAAEVGKELGRLAKKAVPEPPEPEYEDPEHLERLAKVLEHTRGRKALFLGGKPKEERRRELQTVLELDELHWPECEPDSKPSEFEDLAKRVDLLCYLVRWCRKSARQVAKMCKDNGGRVVMIPAGIGIHRVVSDLYTQLVVAQHEAS